MTDSPAYTPPKVWTWNKANGGRFANINRPVAGPMHEKELPVGKAIGERPAVKRGRMVNRINGEPSSQLQERHDAADFLTKTQDKLAG